MQVVTTQTDRTATVKIAGDLRIGTVADAKPDLVAALATCDELQINLGEVHQYDTAGIQLLLMACASARANDKTLTVIGYTDAFRSTLERIGIPLEWVGSQATAHDKGATDQRHRPG